MPVCSYYILNSIPTQTQSVVDDGVPALCPAPRWTAGRWASSSSLSSTAQCPSTAAVRPSSASRSPSANTADPALLQVRPPFPSAADHKAADSAHSLPPAAGCLIDWLLTVPVEQRATVEDVAHHWWLNLGSEGCMCDCPWPRPQKDGSALCSAPLRSTACINWQSDEAGGGGGACSLRRSSKENVAPPTNADMKQHKGILKAQQSFDSLFLSRHSAPLLCIAAPQVRDTLMHVPHVHTTGSPPTSALSQPSSKVPKKGILKTQCEGGPSSGSHAVDPSCPHQQPHWRPPDPQDAPSCPTSSEEAVRRRKGILKRNGKFSRSLDPPTATEILQVPGGAEHSRPSSSVSEESLFSCDSFHLLDLSVQTKRQLFSSGRQRSLCSSEDELELLGEGRG